MNLSETDDPIELIRRAVPIRRYAVELVQDYHQFLTAFRRAGG
jgi:hypothetical protein